MKERDRERPIGMLARLGIMFEALVESKVGRTISEGHKVSPFSRVISNLGSDNESKTNNLSAVKQQVQNLPKDK